MHAVCVHKRNWLRSSGALQLCYFDSDQSTMVTLVVLALFGRKATGKWKLFLL